MKKSLARLSRTFRAYDARTSRSFTLIELLVVMGVIGVLAVLTLMSMSAIANDARLASAKNTVKAALDTARAQAMKNNTVVLLVFRPRLVGTNEQEVDIYLAKWTGESYLNQNGVDVVDRFVPIPAIAVRAISTGIKVAAPKYGSDDDFLWITQAHLPAIDQNTGNGEWAGKMIGIMYGPDGTTITRNSQSDSNQVFVDFNNDGVQNLYDPVPNPSFRYSRTTSRSWRWRRFWRCLTMTRPEN